MPGPACLATSARPSWPWFAKLAWAKGEPSKPDVAARKLRHAAEKVRSLRLHVGLQCPRLRVGFNVLTCTVGLQCRLHSQKLSAIRETPPLAVGPVIAAAPLISDAPGGKPMSEADARCFSRGGRIWKSPATNPTIANPEPVSQPEASAGKARTTIRCRFARKRVVLESDFRVTAATCPHCGLKLVFDPRQETCPVRGLRCRLSDVLRGSAPP